MYFLKGPVVAFEGNNCQAALVCGGGAICLSITFVGNRLTLLIRCRKNPSPLRHPRCSDVCTKRCERTTGGANV